MQEPIITLYSKVETDFDYTAESERYFGAINDSKPLELSIRLWNNRYGKEDVEDLKDFAIRICFSDYEDSLLLKYCSLYMEQIRLNLAVTGNHAIAVIPQGTTVKGTANNGVSTANTNNFKDFRLVFDVTGKGLHLKENDIKNMYLEVIQL